MKTPLMLMPGIYRFGGYIRNNILKNIKNENTHGGPDRTGPVRTWSITLVPLSVNRVFVLLSGTKSVKHCS